MSRRKCNSLWCCNNSNKTLTPTSRLDHGDDRVSFPLCLLFSTPHGCKTELQVMYAGTKLSLVDVAGLTKVFEIRDLDDLTDDWLREKLLK